MTLVVEGTAPVYGRRGQAHSIFFFFYILRIAP